MPRPGGGRQVLLEPDLLCCSPGAVDLYQQLELFFVDRSSLFDCDSIHGGLTIFEMAPR